ncbi:UDP-glucose 4-epimerase [Motilibacter peucedani]|uniref:UDP-glucose 4-epimerase n=1 Tax=Motilibacter peucedani TaxID=598650 RepID=A0A420XNA4_9ACTN|nr:NAD-dependent epimerase/dehydratase family protein [Motilibacter peucedani]RKS72739.1 UDP-glucose 4-epimerase [Motilibacter peucedani]
MPLQVLVTGGSGFVGRSVVPALLKAGHRVRVVDRDAYPDPAVPTVVGELRDPAVRAAAFAAPTDAVVHLAAVTSVLRSVEDPVGTYETNVAVTAGLLELARTTAARRFLLASTNAVVGDVGTATITEDSPLRPLTPYGATKAAGEMLLSGYLSQGLSTCALRFSNVYGPGMAHKDSFVPRLMRAALAGGGVSVYGDGTQVRDLIHVADVARGVLLALGSEVTGPVILGAGSSVRVLDIVEAARRATGREIPAEHVPPKPGEMPAVIVEPARARALGWSPTVSLEDGLRGVWQEFRAAAQTA